ncbi:dimethyl sulfoxide reductase anchor subunit family protein [Vibrio sp. S12_S33]|uniref:dimethyl sulfoxide reductase anchor subunit family protein n=1 Tax=Vibrio sp. S12_S33 TaxID=2720223 RepID=UPI00177EA1C0|nr:DmsC/YnfH family molybdoenzyme membrane anchor subunit [Vibrio sp. S12_S33]MBD1564802.1 dimethyl sulfoxide reductase anchor subunit [Vibrio sp. S12_S33]
MFYETPLIAFTILAQMAVGAHLIINTGQLMGSPASQLNKLRFAVLVVIGLGFIFSTMHLGSPLRAFNAYNRIGDSALSTEILYGSGFAAIAGLLWLVSVLNWGGDVLERILNAISIILGIVFMFAMANVYNMDTVPAWHSIHRVYEFWFTVLTLGTLFGYLLLCLADSATEKQSRIIMCFGVSMICLNLAATSFQLVHYTEISTAIHSGAAQVETLFTSVEVNLFAMVVAAVLWGFTELFLSSNTKKVAALIVLLSLIIAEAYGRNVFYGMHFTAGLY